MSCPQEWKTALATADKADRLLVADFFATWCPPCRVAAPLYGQLSEQFDGVDFVKVDVDKAPKVASANEIRSMPTFKIFKKSRCVHTSSGFNPALISEQLTSLGATKKSPGAKKAN